MRLPFVFLMGSRKLLHTSIFVEYRYSVKVALPLLTRGAPRPTKRCQLLPGAERPLLGRRAPHRRGGLRAVRVLPKPRERRRRPRARSAPQKQRGFSARRRMRMQAQQAVQPQMRSGGRGNRRARATTRREKVGDAPKTMRRRLRRRGSAGVWLRPGRSARGHGFEPGFL